MPHDVRYTDLKFIIEFVYKGEIDVSQAELQVSAFCAHLINYFKNKDSNNNKYKTMTTCYGASY